MEQARQTGKFTNSHDAWWATVRKAHGDRDGTRAMIEVLLLHRNMPHDQVIAGLDAALRAGALTADAVALEAARPPRWPRGRRLRSNSTSRTIRMIPSRR
ncbi:MAG TPA: hypothetical protein VNO54_26010 [Streptosporangiaceae bacterium]|nr:hypothetical protein [Streptosporangiaceae bacterium]